MPKVAVFGSGYLGEKIAQRLGVEVDTSRIRDQMDAYRMVQETDAKVIINAIGFTGSPNVDQCEDPELRYKVTLANVLVPLWLAEATKALDKKLVHISSGCIYNGPDTYSEADAPNFEGSYYSFSKKAAERILEPYGHILTLRVRMPISSDHGPRNLISKLLKYEEIIETPNSVTTVGFFLQALESLIRQDITGVFNVVCPDAITHKQLLQAYDYIMHTDITSQKTWIRPEDLVTKAPRTNCVLSAYKLSGVFDVKNTTVWLVDELEDYAQHD